MTEKFGALAPIYGTLVTSVIAMLIGMPVAFGVAVFLTELCPIWLKRPIGTMIELLAAIPSIIYGIWGLFVFAPFLQQYIEPALIATLGQMPGIGAAVRRAAARHRHADRRLHPGDHGAAVHLVDHARRVRDRAADAAGKAYGLGATTSEVVWRRRAALYPRRRHRRRHAGLGRALGETMAVTFVIGNAHRISASLLAPGTTISATLANEFTEAVGDLYRSSLIALGFILFVITFIVLAIAEAHADAAAEAGGELSRWRLYARRRLVNAVVARPVGGRDRLGLFLLVLVLVDAAGQRHRGAQPALFTQMTPPPGNTAGCSTRSSAAW